MPSACVDVNVRRVRPSGYGRGQNRYGNANACVDGCEGDCEWTCRASVYEHVCGDERVSLSYFPPPILS